MIQRSPRIARAEVEVPVEHADEVLKCYRDGVLYRGSRVVSFKMEGGTVHAEFVPGEKEAEG